MLRRVHRDELMDAPVQDDEELTRSLRQVAAVDRWLGGGRAVRRRLRSRVAGRRDGRILDVGTGNGIVLRRLVRWARRTGGPGWRGVGVDLHPDVIRAAAREGSSRPDHPALVRADALGLPFPDGAFDIAVCTLTLHHFSEKETRRVLAEMARVSRDVVLVSDLERSLLNYLGARLLAATWWRSNRLTRHDGPLSVRRSFTRAELANLGRAAGLEDVRVRRHLPFRLVLTGRPPGGRP